MDVSAAAAPANPDDEYNFDAYDAEVENQVAAISDIATVDPDDDENVSDGEDSEADDDKIKPNDNLLLVGHVDDDAASLEIYGKRIGVCLKFENKNVTMHSSELQCTTKKRAACMFIMISCCQAFRSASNGWATIRRVIHREICVPSAAWIRS